MRKIIIKIMLVTMLVVTIIPLTVEAGYQANKGGTSVTTNSEKKIYANDLFTGIREMESGTLGSTKDNPSDNMNCHMAKNTEWGTIAMLATSIYGDAPEGYSADATTTGNSTGIYQMADGTDSGSNAKGYELVAGIWSGGNSYTSTIISAGKKYYDSYSSEASKPGDATTETLGWKGANTHDFISSSAPIFCRSWQDLFGYHYHDGGSGREYGSWYAGTRAIVVFGEGL